MFHRKEPDRILLVMNEWRNEESVQRPSEKEGEKREHALVLISLPCSLFDLSSSFLTRGERSSHLDRIFSFALLSFSHIALIVDSLFTYMTCSAGTFSSSLSLSLPLSLPYLPIHWMRERRTEHQISGIIDVQFFIGEGSKASSPNLSSTVDSLDKKTRAHTRSKRNHGRFQWRFVYVEMFLTPRLISSS